MIKITRISSETRNNWLIDTTLFISGFFAILSGIYFLFLPVGGYQGGRNPFYNIKVLFDRHTWEDIHMWTGIFMIGFAIIHLLIHWRWIVNMIKKSRGALRGQGFSLNQKGRTNLILNMVVASSFLLCALSGLNFFVLPNSEIGGNQQVPGLLLSRNEWDLVHTWSGILLISSALLHIAIHWRWLVRVTSGVLAEVALNAKLAVRLIHQPRA